MPQQLVLGVPFYVLLDTIYDSMYYSPRCTLSHFSRPYEVLSEEVAL